MTNFLSDLWHDLREKRLWPLALVLLLALVAVPVVLSKSSEEPPAPAPAASDTREAPEPRELKGLAEVKLEEASVGSGSSLDTFDPSNPFRPPSKVIEGSKAESAATASAGPGVSVASGSPPAASGGGGASAGDGGSSVVGGLTGAGDTGVSGGGDTGVSGGGDTGADPEADPDGDDTGGDTGGGETTTTQYRYVVDVTFRANERRRKIKAMERLDMLPNPESPLLLFLGITAGGGDAVFLVDSTLEAAGEGRCKPSGRECAFLHLGPGSEHEFTNEEGDSYTLRVDEIRRVKLGGARKAITSRMKSASRKKTQAARAAVGQPDPRRRFTTPLLADVVIVSSGEAIHSNGDSDRR
jgi:hypothetical protein